MAKSRKKPKKRVSIVRRVENVLAHAMADIGDSCLVSGCWVTYPRDHSAFFRARRDLLRLLREARRG